MYFVVNDEECLRVLIHACQKIKISQHDLYVWFKLCRLTEQAIYIEWNKITNVKFIMPLQIHLYICLNMLDYVQIC